VITFVPLLTFWPPTGRRSADTKQQITTGNSFTSILGKYSEFWQTVLIGHSLKSISRNDLTILACIAFWESSGISLFFFFPTCKYDEMENSCFFFSYLDFHLRHSRCLWFTFSPVKVKEHLGIVFYDFFQSYFPVVWTFMLS